MRPRRLALYTISNMIVFWIIGTALFNTSNMEMWGNIATWILITSAIVVGIGIIMGIITGIILLVNREKG